MVARRAGALIAAFVLCPAIAHAADIPVAAGGSIATAIDQAQPGDTVVVAPGTYTGRIVTKRAGQAGKPITIKSATPRAATITAVGNAVNIAHAYVTFEGFVIDGQNGEGDAVQIETAGSYATIRDCEVKNTRRDCIDMGAPTGVTIEKSLIHDCLNATGNNCTTDACRVDAHGVVGGAVTDLVIRDTEIHTFSGDALQVDPGRASPGWTKVTVERCKMWLGPLATARNGFAAGVVPGENAIDTKTPASGRSALLVKDTIAYGFGGGLIGNMAAFNMKENVDAVFDRVTIRASEIGFRIRNPASVIARNTVLHGMTASAIRYEDKVPLITLEHLTFGRAIANAFDEASSAGTKVEAKNTLFLGANLPPELAGATNLAVGESAFVAAATDDYHLPAGSPAIDKGQAIAGIDSDRDGVARVQGSAPDLGAFEHCPGECAKPPDAGAASNDGGASSSSGGTSGGASGDPNAADPSGAEGSSDSGCGCRTSKTAPGSVAFFALAYVIARALRRKK